MTEPEDLKRFEGQRTAIREFAEGVELMHRIYGRTDGLMTEDGMDPELVNAAQYAIQSVSLQSAILKPHAQRMLHPPNNTLSPKVPLDLQLSTEIAYSLTREL